MTIEPSPLKDKTYPIESPNFIFVGKGKQDFIVDKTSYMCFCDDITSAVSFFKSKIDLMQDKKELNIGQVTKLCSYLQQAFSDVCERED